MKQRPEVYVNDWFKKDKYHEDVIFPVPQKCGRIVTDTEDIAQFTKQLRRPKESRRKSAEEPARSGNARLDTVNCNNCDGQSHNYKGCSKKLRSDLELRKRNIEVGNEVSLREKTCCLCFNFDTYLSLQRN